jgi:general stress protein 26
MTDSTDDQARVWEMMKTIGFCMFTTVEGEALRSRPMAAHAEPQDGAIYFLTDADSAKDGDVEARPQVNLAFADAGSHSYVSVSGRARVSNDRAKIKELFNTPAKAWWDSPEDPGIRLLTVTPEDAQYWDSPGRVRAMIRMAAAAAFSNQRPDMGDNAKVAMDGASGA